MAIETITDVTDAVDLIVTRLTGAQTQVRTSALDRDSAAALLTELSTVQAELKALLSDLADLDPETLLSVVDGLGVIQIWSWRRTLRFDLLQLTRKTAQLIEGTTAFVQGPIVRVVYTTEVDTLQSIAARELGDWKKWPLLVERNPGLSPVDLAPGTAIIIPPPRG